MSERIIKLNNLIKHHVSEILTRELSLKPGVFLTVFKVDTSPDLRYTHIFLSVFPYKESNYAMKTVSKELHKIQNELNGKLKIKPLPRLKFELDSTEEEADKIEKILLEL